MQRVFCCLATALTLSATGAQVTADQSSADTVVVLKDSIVVTANRFGLDRDRVIWPSHIIDRRKLELSSSLGEALAIGSGVDLRSYSGSGSVTTMSNWGMSNRHVLLLYDGRVVRDYSLGGFNLSEYSPDEFDRIELVKGPQSAFFGSDALGGVLNLIPRTTLFNDFRLSTQWGSFGYQRHRIEASRTDGRLGLGGWGEFLQSDNARPNAGAEQKSFGLRSDLLTGDGSHHVWLSGRYFSDSLGSPGPVPEPGVIPAFGDSQSTSRYEHQTDRNYSFDAHYAWHPNRSTQVQFDAFNEHKKLSYYSIYEESWMVPIDTVLTSTTYRKRSSGLTGRFLKSVGRADISAGIDWLYGSLDYESTEGRPSGNSVVTWFGGQRQTDVWGAVSAAAKSFLRPDLSGRLQFVSGRKVQPSYNIGLVLTPAPLWQGKIGYGYAYRLPSLADQFSSDPYTKGNPDLAAEASHTVIASVSTHSPTDRTRMEIALFAQRVNSLIQYQFDPGSYQYVPRNVNRFRSNGIDISARTMATQWMTVEASVVYQRAKQTLDSTGGYVDAFYVPDLTWSLRADYRLSLKVGIGGDVRYTSDRWIRMYDASDKTIGRVYEFGLHAGLTLPHKIRLVVSGQDLTNRKRPTQFGYDRADRDYPGLGRRFSAKLVFSVD
jgi:outer membrane cobalamin receptor